jgi:hypothetical protein
MGMWRILTDVFVKTTLKALGYKLGAETIPISRFQATPGVELCCNCVQMVLVCLWPGLWPWATHVFLGSYTYGERSDNAGNIWS